MVIINHSSPRDSIYGVIHNSEIVEHKVKALLEDLAPDNFDSIADQIISWANKSENERDSAGTLIQVIRLVYNKATDVATSDLEIYVKLCRTMMEKISPGVQDESVKDAEGKPIGGGQLFRKHFLNHVQEDFERAWRDDSGGVTPHYDESSVQIHGVRVSILVAELFKLQMLTERIMHECVQLLLGENVESPGEKQLEALYKLLITAGPLLDTPKARAHMDAYFSRMNELARSPNVRTTTQLMLQDVIKLREQKWVTGNVETIHCIVPECTHSPSVLLRACDGPRFSAHTEFLDSFGIAFPTGKAINNADIIDVPESAEILVLLLRFMHHLHPQPNIIKLPTKTLENLAETVEKYQVYSAIQLCKSEMWRTVSAHPLEVLTYSMRHSYKDLRDEAIFYTVDYPATTVWKIMKEIDLRYFCAWTLFCDQFRERSIQSRYEQAVQTGRQTADEHACSDDHDHWRLFSSEVIDMLSNRHWKPPFVSFDLAVEGARPHLNYCRQCGDTVSNDSPLVVWRRGLDALRREVSLDDWY